MLVCVGKRQSENWPKCICVYFIYLLFFIFILRNCFRFWQTISRYRSRDSFEIAVPYNIPRAHAHTRRQQQSNVLQSNSQFSARFISGMIAGRSRRKIGRYTYNIYVYTHARTHARSFARIAAGQYRIRVYNPCSFSIKSHTLLCHCPPDRPAVNPKVDTRPPLGRRKRYVPTGNACGQTVYTI